MGMFGYWPDPDKNPGDPKQKPKNPADNRPLSFGRILLFICMFGYMIYIVSHAFQPSDNTGGNSSATAELATPEPRKPAMIMDDDAGVLIVYSSASWARDDQLINEMALAKSKWQKQNPHKRVVACDHLRDGPTDYGYCWIIYYEKR